METLLQRVGAANCVQSHALVGNYRGEHMKSLCGIVNVVFPYADQSSEKVATILELRPLFNEWPAQNELKRKTWGSLIRIKGS